MNEIDAEPWFSTQQKLKDDERGGERDALLEKLEACARSVKRQMDAGVAPSEFAQLEKLRLGLDAASQVLANVWRLYHPT